MSKIVFFVFGLFLVRCAWAQNEIKFYYSAKMNLNDSSGLKACQKIKLNSATVKILFFEKNSRTDSLFRDVYYLLNRNDSLFMNFSFPANRLSNADSVVIEPTYHFSCKLDASRGTTFVNKLGKPLTEKFIRLKLKSDPEGSTVYLIPKYLWETDARLRQKNQDALREYKVAAGVTPVWTPVQEYVYVSLFYLNNKFLSVECSPVLSRPVDSVYAEFKRQ